MKIKNKLNEFRIALLYYIFRLCPIDKNKAVFCNYNGKGFGCNPKYIALEMLRRNPGRDIVWVVKKKDAVFPEQIRTVYWDSMRAIYELATADIWIDNQRKLWYHRKRKKQFFLETWHGAGIPIKKIGADNPNNYSNKPYRHTSVHMNRITNVMISNSVACTEIFHRAFLYDGPIVNCGYPRNDILVKDLSGYRKNLRTYLHLKSSQKICLYAPTYRNGRKLNVYRLDYQKTLSALQQRFGGEWVILLRLHPTIQNVAPCTEQVFDVSGFDDTQELLAGSDVLISDYSSVITEFALTKQPVFLYAEDVSDYTDERSFYTNYFDLPFSVAQNNCQLEKNIAQFNWEQYRTAIKKAFEQYGIVENGTAAAQVVDIIDRRLSN